jgi:hypothetical protein
VAVIWNPDVRGALLDYKQLEEPARARAKRPAPPGHFQGLSGTSRMERIAQSDSDIWSELLTRAFSPGDLPVAE